MFKSEEEGKSHSQNVKFPQRDNVQIGGCWRWRCCTVGPGHTVLPEPFCWGILYNNRKKMTFTCEYINIVAIFWGMHKQQLFIEKIKSTPEDIVGKEARRGNRATRTNSHNEITYTLVVVGDGGVAQSALVIHFFQNLFFSGIWYNNRKEMTIAREYINIVKIEQFLVNT